jgi:hypothetical protein
MKAADAGTALVCGIPIDLGRETAFGAGAAIFYLRYADQNHF